ncbi:hypothetical protein CTI12_AA503080 [Artemisia annua]|uniref:Retrotransposon gag domain-containing protein n=1 Tax=Artemisia annua TaxID=35608 RepID=A0A2U1LDH3_ARTAN|nr:hypothetical protein CTI12_AA503080 [Artemisia annua]
MVKAADFELEFNQYNEGTNARLTTLENELASMRLEANQRSHEEVESTKGFRSYDDIGLEILETSAAGGKKKQREGLKKLKMPIFDGDDAYGWIYRMERIFKIQGVEALDQLQVAELCLEGEALSWHCWSEGRSPFRSWDGLKRRLLNRFQQTQQGNMYEQFLTITQVETAREYVALFEKLAGQLVGVSEQVLEATFIKGLKPDLRAALRVMHPEGLNHAMILAVTIKENKTFDNGARGGGSYRSGGTTTNFSGYRNNTSSTRTLLSTASTSNKGGNNSTGRISQFKRLTEAELADKRSKGLCFKCDQKFGPGHQCASRSLQVLLVDEDDEYEDVKTRS